MKYASLSTGLVCGLLLLSTGEGTLAADGRDVSSVNGSVAAEEGKSYGELTTVNGAVRVGRAATASLVKTVNGSIAIEDDARIGTASTVNGALRVGSGVSIDETASTVNGKIDLATRVRVGGDVSTVSGDITLRGAEVTGQLVTTNGDIRLQDGARVRGGIHVKDPKGWFSDGERRRVRVDIGPNCVVEGTLQFDRAVDLRVDPSAKVGKIVGDSVRRL